jgi:hypothetical protein
VWILLLAGVGLLLLAAFLLWSGRETQRLVNIMRQAVPADTAQIASAFPGELVSITGTARSRQPLVSEHGNTPSLYYTSSVERSYETTEYESGTKNRAGRHVTTKHTETVSENTQWADFAVEDDSGRVDVRPDHRAEFDARESVNRYVPVAAGGSSFSLGGFTLLGSGDRTLGHRYRESTIPVNAPVYVVGVVSEDGGIVSPAPERSNAALIISYRSQSALVDDWQSSARWLAYGAIGSVIAGIGSFVIAAIITFL